MTLTPWMQQYFDLKEQAQDAILFFRLWDFYEMFAEDAHIAHKVLWISITSRNKNAKEPLAMAGIPFHAKAKYLPMLVNAWYKVAIAEQVSDPKLKWIVKREIVRVIIPSTLELEGEEFQSSSENPSNIMVAITENNGVFWASFLDISSNKWFCSEFITFDGLKEFLYKISPKEIVLEKKLFWNKELKEVLEMKYALNIYYFEERNNPEVYLKNYFWVKNLDWYGISWFTVAQEAASLLIQYFQSNQNNSWTLFNKISYLSFDSFMNLDESTIHNLDLIYNFSTKSAVQWTLFWVLNKTKTWAGNRYLRQQILRPLQDINEIETRQKYIHEFYKNKLLLDKVRDELTYVSDIDAILNRIALNRANPRDLLNLKRSLESIIKVVELIKNSNSTQLKKLFKL